MNPTVIIYDYHWKKKKQEQERFYSSNIREVLSFIMPAPPSPPFSRRGFSHPHLFCKLIQGHQQPDRLIKQSVRSRGSFTQWGQCMWYPLFSSPTEVDAKLLLSAYVGKDYICFSMNVLWCISGFECRSWVEARSPSGFITLENSQILIFYVFLQNWISQIERKIWAVICR